MPRGTPLAEETIASIKRLAGEGKSVLAISRELGCARSTVEKYAPPGSFDRSQTEVAVAAAKFDAAARRAAIRQQFLEVAGEFLERARGEYDMAQPAGSDGEVRHWTMPKPPARDAADFVRAAAAASAAELRIAERDGDGNEDAREAIISFGDAVRAAAAARRESGET